MNRTRRPAVVAALLVWSLTACASGPDAVPAWRHPAGVTPYRLEVVEQNPDGTRRIEFDLRLRIDGDEAWIELLAGRRLQPDGSVHTIGLPEGCAPAAPGVLARLPLRPPIDLDAVPLCVPEPLFGGLTDALTFVLLQADPAFGLERLVRVGDAIEWTGFATTWHRPPALLEAAVACPCGTTRLVGVADGVARYGWQPARIDLAMVRTMGGGGSRLLLAGEEQLELEIRVDTRSGRLLGGHAIRDELALTLWPAFAGDRVPAAEQRPREGGLPITIRRTLRFELADAEGAGAVDGDAGVRP